MGKLNPAWYVYCYQAAYLLTLSFALMDNTHQEFSSTPRRIVARQVHACVTSPFQSSSYFFFFLKGFPLKKHSVSHAWLSIRIAGMCHFLAALIFMS